MTNRQSLFGAAFMALVGGVFLASCETGPGLDNVALQAGFRTPLTQDEKVLPSIVPSQSYDFRGGIEALARRVAAGPGPGAAVITAGMNRIEKGTILKGSCYDFANAVYVDAGFTPGKRATIYAAREAGPYADPSLIQPGDWIYFDHMYADKADHSIIFVAWLNFESHTALTIDYPGADRAEPGRYRVADLYKIWGITRPVLK